MRMQQGFGVSLRAATALALALLGALLISSQASAQEETISIGRITVAADAQGEVDLEALNIEWPGLAAWMIDISYDASVVTPVICIARGGGVCNPQFASGTARIIGATATGLQGDTTLANLTFRCNREGSTALSLNVQELFDARAGDPQRIDAAVVSGAVSCVTPRPAQTLPGDANCDGVVNSVDAALVLQFVAGLRVSLPCRENADVNGDGRVDARDAALILQIDAGLFP